MKKIVIAIIIISITAGLHFLSQFGHISEIKRWESPDKKFALSVISRRSYIDLFGMHDQFMIVIGRSGGVSDYGHPKDYSFINGTFDYEKYINKCTVKWDNHGATFEEPEGDKLFIPKHAYQNGR